MTVYRPFQRNEIEDTPENRQELARLLMLYEKADDLSKTAEIKLLGQIGTAYRRVGEFETAAKFFQQGVETACSLPDPKSEVANLVRLATMLHYLDRHTEALPLFYSALALSGNGQIPEYEDFVCQHLGKCLVEMERLAEVRSYFERALQLREIKGEPELLDSTRQALAALENMLNS